MPIDRKIFFDSVRPNLFGGSMEQSQVDGMNAILDAAQAAVEEDLPWVILDLRHLGYCLATTYYETSQEMQPIEEYGKGKGQPYGVVDLKTGYAYYGRGYVQLTWADNYKSASLKLDLTGADDLYQHPDRALDPTIASDIMFQGMEEGWFRSDSHGRQTLVRYFNDTVNDAYGAREIINGDKNVVPKWSNGVSIGNLIKGYHGKFLAALQAAYVPLPEPVPPSKKQVARLEGDMEVWLNGVQIA